MVEFRLQQIYFWRKKVYNYQKKQQVNMVQHKFVYIMLNQFIITAAKVTKRFLVLLLHSSIILRGRMPGTEFLVPCQWTPVIGNASIAAQC